MIVLSMVLVVVGFVLLMLGVLGVGESPLDFVYYSIGACLLAAVFLIIGVIRGRPSKKPVAASGGEGKEASWSGASAWNDAAEGERGDRTASTAVLERDQVSEEEPRVQVVAAQDVAGEEDPRAGAPVSERSERRDGARAPGAPVSERSERREGGQAPGAPARERREGAAVPGAPTDDEGWAPQEPPEPQEAGSPPEAHTEDGVVPRTTPASAADDRTAHTVRAEDVAATAEDETASGASPAGTTTAGKATAGKATARKAGAAPPGSEERKFEDALSDVSGVGAAKRRNLLDHFGTYEQLRSASVQELARVQGISQTLATRIRMSLDARSD